MFNAESIRAVEAARFAAGLTRPLYDSYCFSRIPATVLSAFEGGLDGLPADALPDPAARYDAVVCCLADAFGWRFFERHLERNAVLKRLAASGPVSKLTSQFPSTTATHTWTINAGLEAAQSGLWEWEYYDSRVGRSINVLKFS